MSPTAPGTLDRGEPHPSARDAMAWFRVCLPARTLAISREALASAAMSGDRAAEVGSETLERLLRGDPVSDRYLLGLCWMLRDMVDYEEADVDEGGGA